MFAEESFLDFAQAQLQSASSQGTSKKDVPKKGKKISKPFDKNGQRHVKVKEWSRVQKLCYARLLLTTIMHSLSIGASFFECLANQLSRNPREVYIFHRNMISEFRTNRSIVRELLGTEAALKGTRSAKQNRPSTISKRQQEKTFKLVDTNSSEGFVSTDEMAMLDALIVDKSPELMGDCWQEQMEIQDYIDDNGDCGYPDEPYNLDYEDSWTQMGIL